VLYIILETIIGDANFLVSVGNDSLPTLDNFKYHNYDKGSDSLVIKNCQKTYYIIGVYGIEEFTKFNIEAKFINNRFYEIVSNKP